MEKNIYILLSATYFLLGIISVTKTKFNDFGLKAFLVLTVVLPITKFTTNFHIIFQVSIYYYFFIGVSLIYIVKILKNKVSRRSFNGVSLVGAMFIFYIFHYLFFVDKITVEITDLLKDIKPFVLLIFAFIFIDHYEERLKSILTRKFCNWVLLLNAIACSIFFYFMLRHNIHLKLTPDPYYRYEELRLETLGSYFGLFYILYLLLNGLRPSLKEVLLCIIPLLFTGNRTVIAASIIVAILYFLLGASLQKIVIFFSAIGVMLVGFFYSVISAAEDSPLFRFKKLLEPEYIEYALLNRFSPFVDALKSFSFLDYIFGKGFGFAFFIPWFVWRANIKNYNVYIDNLYLTLYAKYGIFSILFFIILFIFLKTFLKTKTALFYFLFILLISITNAFIYQYNFLWILLMFTLPFNPIAMKTRN